MSLKTVHHTHATKNRDRATAIAQWLTVVLLLLLFLHSHGWAQGIKPTTGGSGGGGTTSSVTVNDPGVTSQKLAVDATGKIGVNNFPATQPVTGTFWQPTQPVSGVFWQTTQPVSGIFWQTTQPVSGTFWQATQPVSIATMPSTPVTGIFFQAIQPVSGTVTANDVPPTLTKGTQSATGFSVQNLKDAGRTYVMGSLLRTAGVTTEALGTVNWNKGGTNAAATTYTVTAAKTLRLEHIFISCTQTLGTVAVQLCAARLRSGATCTATSNPIGVLEASMPSAVLNTSGQAWKDWPDGFEIAAGQLICVSHVENSTSASVTIGISGYEY